MCTFTATSSRQTLTNGIYLVNYVRYGVCLVYIMMTLTVFHQYCSRGKSLEWNTIAVKEHYAHRVLRALMR